MTAYEVRFDNGASMTLTDVHGFAAAAEQAIESLLSCMPPGTRRDQITQVSIVRCFDGPGCYLCGKKLWPEELVEIEPSLGAAAALCVGCTTNIISTARLRKFTRRESLGIPLVVDPNVPPGEIHARQDGKTVAKTINLEEPDPRLWRSEAAALGVALRCLWKLSWEGSSVNFPVRTALNQIMDMGFGDCITQARVDLEEEP